MFQVYSVVVQRTFIMSEETQTQVGGKTCPRPRGEDVLELGFEPRLSVSKTCGSQDQEAT